MDRTDSPPPTPPPEAWHSQPVETVLNQLATHREKGLSTAEAQQRLEQYGHNELREKPPTPFWRLIVDQLNNFVVILLIIASAISFVLGDEIEAAAIMAIVILNAVIGVIQESRAEASLAALKKLAAPEARVIRDGSRFNVPGRELVPGDVVLTENGPRVHSGAAWVKAPLVREPRRKTT